MAILIVKKISVVEACRRCIKDMLKMRVKACLEEK